MSKPYRKRYQPYYRYDKPLAALYNNLTSEQIEQIGLAKTRLYHIQTTLAKLKDAKDESAKESAINELYFYDKTFFETGDCMKAILMAHRPTLIPGLIRRGLMDPDKILLYCFKTGRYKVAGDIHDAYDSQIRLSSSMYYLTTKTCASFLIIRKYDFDAAYLLRVLIDPNHHKNINSRDEIFSLVLNYQPELKKYIPSFTKDKEVNEEQALYILQKYPEECKAELKKQSSVNNNNNPIPIEKTQQQQRQRQSIQIEEDQEVAIPSWAVVSPPKKIQPVTIPGGSGGSGKQNPIIGCIDVLTAASKGWLQVCYELCGQYHQSVNKDASIAILREGDCGIKEIECYRTMAYTVNYGMIAPAVIYNNKVKKEKWKDNLDYLFNVAEPKLANYLTSQDIIQKLITSKEWEKALYLVENLGVLVSSKHNKEQSAAMILRDRLHPNNFSFSVTEERTRLVIIKELALITRHFGTCLPEFMRMAKFMAGILNIESPDSECGIDPGLGRVKIASLETQCNFTLDYYSKSSSSSTEEENTDKAQQPQQQRRPIPKLTNYMTRTIAHTRNADKETATLILNHPDEANDLMDICKNSGYKNARLSVTIQLDY